jgi:hypothetical protein
LSAVSSLTGHHHGALTKPLERQGEIEVSELKVNGMPIRLSPQSVMLIQTFPAETRADQWSREDARHVAEQLIEQLGDNWLPAFLMALRHVITDTLASIDEAFDTSFATEHQPSS